MHLFSFTASTCVTMTLNNFQICRLFSQIIGQELINKVFDFNICDCSIDGSIFNPYQSMFMLASSILEIFYK